jgi:hypothetical protein
MNTQIPESPASWDILNDSDFHCHVTVKQRKLEFDQSERRDCVTIGPRIVTLFYGVKERELLIHVYGPNADQVPTSTRLIALDALWTGTSLIMEEIEGLFRTRVHVYGEQFFSSARTTCSVLPRSSVFVLRYPDNIRSKYAWNEVVRFSEKLKHRIDN